MTTAYLSLGSNLGDREALLREALRRLETAGVRVVRQSSIHETEPQDLREQPWFLNMAVQVETELTARELLSLIHTIESALGRTREIPKGPRTIDIDILYYGDAVIDEPDLQIPHPRMHQRSFVLDPLAEIK